jgi:hypothetical protein
MEGKIAGSAGSLEAAVRFRRAPLLHHHKERCDSATEQD